MAPSILDLQSFAKRILNLLGVGVQGDVELEIQKLQDGSVRIRKDEESRKRLE